MVGIDLGWTFLLFTSPARRAWRSYKLASLNFSFFFFFFSASKVELPLMGDTTGTNLCEPIQIWRLTAEYVNKTCSLASILQHLNCEKVLRDKIFSCKMFIMTNSTAKISPGAMNRGEI